MCHGDYAPYNVVLRGKEAIGIIDFDTVHPGPRAWDIAYALYRWAPLTNPQNHDGFGDLETQVKRAAIFCNIYGLHTTERRDMSELVIERLMALVDFMIIEAGRGNHVMQDNIADKHHLLYIADANYISNNKAYIDDKLCA